MYPKKNQNECEEQKGLKVFKLFKHEVASISRVFYPDELRDRPDIIQTMK